MKTKQTAEPIYTMKDVLKYRKAAYLAARVSGEENFALTQFCEEPNPFKSAHINKRSFSELAGYFEPYLNGLTIEQMEKIYTDFFSEVYRRREEKDKFRPPSETGGRLRPLGKQAYEHFAKYVWEKRGKPFFTKAPVGVKWGKPVKNRSGSTQFLAYIGCEISTNLRSKKFLKLSIAD